MPELIAIAQERVQRVYRLPASPSETLDLLAARLVLLHDICTSMELLDGTDSACALIGGWRKHAAWEFSAALTAYASHLEES